MPVAIPASVHSCIVVMCALESSPHPEKGEKNSGVGEVVGNTLGVGVVGAEVVGDPVGLFVMGDCVGFALGILVGTEVGLSVNDKQYVSNSTNSVPLNTKGLFNKYSAI